MINLKLHKLNQNLKTLILSYLIVLGIGMTFGLGYIYLTSEMNPSGMMDQYLGNNDEWEPKLPKTAVDLVSQAHDHITMFSIIFLTIGLIFNQNSLIKGIWKKILMIEPFFSIIITCFVSIYPAIKASQLDTSSPVPKFPWGILFISSFLNSSFILFVISV